MKKLPKFTLPLTMLLVSALNYAQPTAPSGKKWVKAEYLSDEFNGSFDTSKWEKPTWNYTGTPTNMVTGNSGVSGGNLWIKATLDNTNALWFKSSRVQSKATVGFPMYTECRIKAANISAYTTYWLNNGNINDRNEIDICENNPKPSITSQNTYRPYTMYSQYFIVKNGVTERNAGNFDNRNLPNGNPAKGKKWNEAYQVLGCYWKDSKNVQFYINGAPAGKVTSTGVFTLAQNIIWDLWTGPFDYLGGLAVKSDLNNNSWNTMYVDWVHTYTLVNSTAKYANIDKTSISSNENNLLHPNPAIASLNLSIKSGMDYNTFSIMDMNGRTISQEKIAEGVSERNIDISGLKPGQYFLTIKGNNDSETLKFIKK